MGAPISSNYDRDYILIGIAIAVSIAGIVQLIRHRKELFNCEDALIPLMTGILIVLLTTIANSFFEHHWEFNYIVDFLLLKRVTKSFFFRDLCQFGYIFLSWGLAMIVIITINKMGQSLQNENKQ